MLAALLLFACACVVIATSTLSLKNGFFLVVFLFGTYPRFLAMGLGEGGFAITGPRVFLSILAIVYLLKFLAGSKDIATGLRVLANEKVLVVVIALMILAKVAGSIAAGRFDVGAIGALGTDILLYPLVIVLAATYMQSVRDFYIIFGCIGLSIICNELAVIVEAVRGVSVFQGIVEVQFETFSDIDLLAGKSRDGSYRSMGLTPNPLVLARLLCIGLPGLAVLVLRRSGLPLRTIAFVALLGLLPTLLMTQSRAAIALALAVFAYLAFVLLMANANRTLRNLTATVVLAGLLGILVLWADQIASLAFEGGGVQGLRSSQSRILQYITVLPMINTSPLIGFGYARNYDLLLDVGNIDGHYLYLALQGGLIAVFCLCIAIGRAIMITIASDRRLPSEENQAINWAVRVTLLVMAALMLVYSMHNSNLYLALFLGAAVALRSKSQLRSTQT